MPFHQPKQLGFYMSLISIALAATIILTGVFPPFYSIFFLIGAVCATYNNQLMYRASISRAREGIKLKTNETQIAHNHLVEKQAILESLTNMLPASIAFISKDHCFQYANITCQKWFGGEEIRLYGKHLREVIGMKNYNHFKLIFEDAHKNDTPVTFSRNINTANGAQKNVRISILPVENDGCLFFIEDLTDLKTSEVRMKQMNLELEAQIEEKNKFKERMLEVNKELQQFASVASHDMKEPLRTISSFSNLLARRIPEDERSQEFLGFIRDSAKRMTQLLEDLISYARTGLDQQPRQKVNLDDVVLTVKNNLYSKIEENNAKIITDNLPVVNGHYTALTQIFQNIISNGIKFQKSDNSPVISINTRYEKNQCIVSISDNGIGMEPQYYEQIFEPFRRLHSRAEYEGSGIGLATCKKIMDEYQGDLCVTSEVGVGTTFLISFPMEMISQPDAQLSIVAA